MKLEEIKVFYHWVQRFRETDRGQYSEKRNCFGKNKHYVCLMLQESSSKLDWTKLKSVE